MSTPLLIIGWALALIIGLVVGLIAGAVLMSRRLDGGSIGVQMIAVERKSQKRKGYTLDHDRLHMAIHGLGHLAGAGAAYALRAIGQAELANQLYTFGDALPEQHTGIQGEPGPVHDLVAAGALIAAEIDLQTDTSMHFEERKLAEAPPAQTVVDPAEVVARADAIVERLNPKETPSAD